MRLVFRMWCLTAAICALGVCGRGQSRPGASGADPQTAPHQDKAEVGPVREIGKGGEDIGIGAARGTADVAKGTAGAIGNLAHGSVGSAVASFGKGAGGLAKNVAVGTGKGVAWIGRGIGGEFKKL
ncbi:MAG: hypothetical protein ABSF45_24585 [Terriglobia bacterium]